MARPVKCRGPRPKAAFRRPRSISIRDRQRPLKPPRKLSISGHAPRGRHYVLHPGEWSPLDGGHPWSRIEVWLARTRAFMLRDCWVITGGRQGHDTEGCVVQRLHNIGRDRFLKRGRPGRWRGGTIAHVFLNERDWQQRPSEIGSHEMVHAGMAFMRSRKVDPSDGHAEEEALAWTVGSLVKQLNNVWYAHSFRL
jgi:hypothetical protein